jgi:hypothetical protein
MSAVASTATSQPARRFLAVAERSSTKSSRRALLGAAVGATAATVAVAVARPLPATATTDHVSYLNNENGNTVIRARSVHQSGLTKSGMGIAVRGHSDKNTGVYGESIDGFGVVGTSTSSAAVYGTSTVSIGIYGTSQSSFGALGHAEGASSAGTVGWSSANGTGILGTSDDANHDVPAAPANTGVYGYARTGRGGQFAGATAQIRLVPAAAASHPANGVAGDLFADGSGRLWFCTKGGSAATWKQIV